MGLCRLQHAPLLSPAVEPLEAHSSSQLHLTQSTKIQCCKLTSCDPPPPKKRQRATFSKKHNSHLGTKRSAMISKEAPYLSHQGGFNSSLGACGKVTTRAALLPCLGRNADLCCALCFSAIGALYQRAAKHSSGTHSAAERRGANSIFTSSNPPNHAEPPCSCSNNCFTV